MTYNNFTHIPSLTYNNFTHNNSHTITHTHNFVTYHLSHTITSLSHTLSQAQPHIHLRFAWQAWHNLTSTIVSQSHIHHRFAWQAWHSWHWVARLDSPVTPVTPRHFAWHGTTSHPPSFHVTGVAQSHIHHRFAWQAWHSWHWVARLDSPVTPVTPRHFAWQAWHNLTSTLVLRSRRGTISHPPSFRVAGVALMALGGALGLAWFPVTPGTPRHFAWQAWHNLTTSQKNVCTVAHSRHFHTHHLSHPTLSHIHTYMHACMHTYIHTYIHTYTIFSHTFTHSLSPPPLSFLPSPSPLQPLKLSILRS